MDVLVTGGVTEGRRIEVVARGEIVIGDWVIAPH